MTLVDEDTNSIITVDTNSYCLELPYIGQFKAMWQCSDITWWPSFEPMHVAPSGGRICNKCKWGHLVGKFATYASGTIWWTNLQLIQVAPSGGQICNWCITQVKEAIPWVRCASGNVYLKLHISILLYKSSGSRIWQDKMRLDTTLNLMHSTADPIALEKVITTLVKGGYR